MNLAYRCANDRWYLHLLRTGVGSVPSALCPVEMAGRGEAEYDSRIVAKGGSNTCVKRGAQRGNQILDQYLPLIGNPSLGGLSMSAWDWFALIIGVGTIVTIAGTFIPIGWDVTRR